jgi:hypothetical protein
MYWQQQQFLVGAWDLEGEAPFHSVKNSFSQAQAA